jgi:hypothetical protein
VHICRFQYASAWGYKHYSIYNNTALRVMCDDEYNLYSSPNTIKMIKSRRMGWAGHVAGIREIRNAYKILVGKSERKRPLSHTG